MSTVIQRVVVIDGEEVDLATCDGWRPSEKSVTLLQRAIEGFEALGKYLPLSLRQIYYWLVGRAFIENSYSSYRTVMNILGKARVAGVIPWSWMEDRTRVVHAPRTFSDPRSYLDNELEWFLSDYQRDIMQTQDVSFVLCSEKDALRPIFQRIADPYRIPVWIVKGFSSKSYTHDLAQSITNEKRETGRNSFVAYAGDFDPSGLDIPRALAQSIRDDHGVYDFELQRVGLTYDQVREHDLPTDPTAAKDDDPRLPSYLEVLKELGVDPSDRPAWELDALPPEDLVTILNSAIKTRLRTRRLKAEIKSEENDLESLAAVREDAVAYVKERAEEEFGEGEEQ